jgi:hypothetical protein
VDSSAAVLRFASQPGECEALCGNFSTCTTCSSATGCYWCLSSRQCIPDYATLTKFGSGQCLAYAPATCSYNCNLFSNNTACQRNPRCGWCGSTIGLTNGTCYEGIASGPGLYLPQAGTPCSQSSSSVVSASLSNSTWSYVGCLNVNQCLYPLLNQCGPNAICTDLPDCSSQIGPAQGYSFVYLVFFEFSK